MINQAGKGVKYDADKVRWSLLPFDALEKIVRVLMFGAKKYADDNWKIVEHSPDRYFSACMRHLVAWKNGEKIDSETGINHLAHAGCCILFMLWHDEKDGKNG